MTLCVQVCCLLDCNNDYVDKSHDCTALYKNGGGGGGDHKVVFTQSKGKGTKLKCTIRDVVVLFS